jgi:hypothetical protein
MQNKEEKRIVVKEKNTYIGEELLSAVCEDDYDEE